MMWNGIMVKATRWQANIRAIQYGRHRIGVVRWKGGGGASSSGGSRSSSRRRRNSSLVKESSRFSSSGRGRLSSRSVRSLPSSRILLEGDLVLSQEEHLFLLLQEEGLLPPEEEAEAEDIIVLHKEIRPSPCRGRRTNLPMEEDQGVYST